MANTIKKTTAKTEAVEAKTNEEVIESVEIVEEKPVATKKIEKEKKVFTDSDYILCRSVWSGGLNVTSQSGNLYKFKDYGSDCEINYRDLVTMIRRGSEHIFKPRFIIMDDDFLVDFPTVKRVYGEMYTREDLLKILDLPVSRMKSEIAKLPEDTKNSMCALATTQIVSGRLDSISKVRALTELFNLDFNLLSDLFVK